MKDWEFKEMSFIQLPSYLPVVERVEVTRDIEEMEAKAEMLRSYGYTVSVEVHCGFFLIHWMFPKLELVWPPEKPEKPEKSA